MSFPCFLCKCPLKAIDSLVLHLKIEHPSNKTFSCIVCNRKYGGQYDSYRKHLIRVHKVPLHVNPESPEQNGADLNLPHSTNNLLADEYMTCDSDNTDLGPVGGEANEATLFDNFDDSLIRNVDILIAKLYSKPGLPRNLVDSMVTDITDFLSADFLKILQNLCFQNLDKGTPDHVRFQLTKMFDTVSNPFKHMSTEYKRFQHFQTLGSFIPPRSYVIDSRMERVRGVPQMKDVTGQFIPLRQVLQKFFELPDVFNVMEASVKELESDDDGMLRSFIQSDVWKRKRSMYPADAHVFP